MLAGVGFLIVLVAVFGTYLMSGGNFTIIAHAMPHELAAIGGAALGAFIVSNQLPVLKAAGRGLLRSFKGPRWKSADYRDLLVLLFLLADRIKRDGAMGLEADVERPAESALFSRFPRLAADHHLMDFICDYIRMATIDEIDVYHAAEAMDADLERHHHEEQEPQHALQTMADGLPAIGIVAAVLGVIKTMGSIDQPTEVLGAMIGGALVGTFLGVLLAYCFVGPLASRLAQVIEEDAKPYTLVRSVLLSAFKGVVPQISVEIARRITPSLHAPSFTALEAAISEAKMAKAA
jgi:chemotaxis protein MotA